MNVIDMKAMRYINLLDKISHVQTHRCFVHNDTIFFAVNEKEIARAIGSAAVNIRRIEEKINKKVKIIKEPAGIWEAKRFIEGIVSPVKIKAIEVKDKCIIITGGSNQTKASLIGRNKGRYEELKKILHDFFG